MSTADELIAGRYRLVSKLGSGGMGVVWEAWDERLERRVAIKQLHPQRGLSPAEAELANARAMREARINARLHHRYAVPVFDVAEHEGQPCLIMQFVPSVPLAALLREAGPLEPAEAAQVGAQIASALAAAHQAGIVHRDVKPGNILIADDGTALISDFGISHAMGDATLTETGMVHGTPAYLAPEVARGGQASHASDVFSLGATLYAALEGRPPFGTDQNSIALLHRVATGEFEPPQRSGALEPILLATLAADPAARPAMPAVARRLAELAAADRFQAPPTTATVAAQVPDPADASTRVDDRTWIQDRTPDVDQTRVRDRPPVDARTPVAGTVPVALTPQTVPTAYPLNPGREVEGTTLLASRARRRPGGALLAMVGVVVAAILAAALWLGVRPDSITGATPGPSSSVLPAPSTEPSSDPTPSSSPSSSPSPTTSPTSSPTSTRSPTTSPSSTTPSPTRTPSPSTSTPIDGRPTASQLAAALDDYYAALPGGTDQGWQRLTASYQRTAGGRGSYDRFWGNLRRVSATNITGRSPDRATATITYVDRSGQTSRERRSFRLVTEDGVLKINASTVL